MLVCVDTSGSIDTDAIGMFAGELMGILRAYPQMRCDLYYADAELYGPWAVRAGGDLPRPVGGGGTDFKPFFEKTARHPFTHGRTVAVYLTDGFGDFRKENDELMQKKALQRIIDHAAQCNIEEVAPFINSTLDDISQSYTLTTTSPLPSLICRGLMASHEEFYH